MNNIESQKTFLIAQFLIYLLFILTYFLTISHNQILGDDAYFGLIDQNPKIIGQQWNGIERISKENCETTFNKDSLKGKFLGIELWSSHLEPRLFLKTDNEKIPLYFNRRNGGIPYYVFKKTSEIIGLHQTKVLFDLTMGLITLLFFIKGVSTFSSKAIAITGAALLSISPIFQTAKIDIIGEHLMLPMFWILFYLLQKNEIKYKILASFCFILGLYLKITFVVALIPLAILFKDQFIKNKTFVFGTAVISLGYFLVLTLTPGGSEEFFSRRGDQGLLKGFRDVLMLLENTLTLMLAPLASMDDQFIDLPFELDPVKRLINLPLLAYVQFFIILGVIGLVKIEKLFKPVAASFFVYVVILFFQGHGDLTYSSYINETICLFVLALILIFASKVKKEEYKTWKNVLLCVFAIIYVYQSNEWVRTYRKYGPHPTMNLSYTKMISDYLVSNNILTPIIADGETEFGAFEKISEGKISPIFAESIPKAKSYLNQCSDNENIYFLLYLRETVFYDNPKDGLRYIKNKIQDLDLGKIEEIADFPHNGQPTYKLIRVR